jgi:hypothetical protein
VRCRWQGGDQAQPLAHTSDLVEQPQHPLGGVGEEQPGECPLELGGVVVDGVQEYRRLPSSSSGPAAAAAGKCRRHAPGPAGYVRDTAGPRPAEQNAQHTVADTTRRSWATRCCPPSIWRPSRCRPWPSRAPVSPQWLQGATRAIATALPHGQHVAISGRSPSRTRNCSGRRRAADPYDRSRAGPGR